MNVKVAINGFGRIGRLVARHLKVRKGFDLVAINDLTSPDMLGYLFEYDSVHGRYRGTVEVAGTDLIIDGDRMQVLAERDPASLPWGSLGVDYVIEATGLFVSRAKAGAHLEAGAKKVIITAPGKEVDATFVVGVNHESYDPAAHHVVSNASCTTNCLAPMAKVVHETVGIRHGWLTTIHAYTNDQRILDVQHSKDMRRARAAAVNIIPTSTGAAKAIGLVYPELAGKLDGAAMRVPVPDASVCDLTFVAGREGNVSELRAAFVDAAAGSLKGILKATEVPIVSSDVIGETHSTVIDLPLVSQVAPDFFRVVGWYDNENAYALRCVDLLEFMAGRDRA
ncbi:MAG TPA: type I glyceraldehyde-3-phosphate dehydrogenase [Thermoanaerobaculales bacterium]|nr:type I glyceraldehyde-3-phosphate dehydrogenase [Thermoanaerobaculales bacterium]HPA80345.1 type I glyceraldehyde-3-phosphate dehydrogenase [Thermoanaerobaculales bacterium]HQL28598.1 type I glyceraldehyde-3-phosphate dehydrogenase [Thermoanaerobaculales bacterium]HQN95768.1 type I glyceraldehyde-3-phosphate dehydrogenase [Thermoanaerobaculales bacterium]